MTTAYENGYISFLLGRALEENPYTQTTQRKANLHPFSRRFNSIKTERAINWERGWKKASSYSVNDRYPTPQEQIYLN